MMRKYSSSEWKEKFTEPFSPWNYDCFGVIDDYKHRIRIALEVGDSKNICETCLRKTYKKRIPKLNQGGGIG